MPLLFEKIVDGATVCDLSGEVEEIIFGPGLSDFYIGEGVFLDFERRWRATRHDSYRCVVARKMSEMEMQLFDACIIN
jgi:hypothetical protein